METKKHWETLLKWASENEKNRIKAITAASTLIMILNNTKGKKLSKKDIEKIAGGIQKVGPQVNQEIL